LLIKARLLVDKKQLYYFKVWQANVVRHDLKGICSSLGHNLQTQKHLCLRVLNKVFQRHLSRVFWTWKEQPKVQSLPLSEPKTLLLLKLVRVVLLKGKMSSNLSVHLGLLKQMYQRAQSKDCLTQ
jgi:hypothetical protein